MEKLDCLLIHPPSTEEGIWKTINRSILPIGLASIAAFARSKGHSVKIIDCEVECPSLAFFEDYFGREFSLRFDSIRFIGLTAVTSSVKKAYKIAELCKQIYPDAMIVFGGVHATCVTDEVIGKEYVDFVVLGEGELSFEQLVSGRALEEIKGLVFKKNGKVVYNGAWERIKNLDELPMPAYDLLPLLKYHPAEGTYKKLPAVGMTVSRGCPGNCTFCTKILGSKLAMRSAEVIFNEIKYLADNYGIKQIQFYDDTFTIFKKTVARLCDLLIENEMSISWTCFSRIDFVDFPLLQKMGRAGCHQIMYGVENIDENVLKNMNKKIDSKQVEKAVKWTKDAGIECRLAFMVGSRGDSLEVIKENINFIKKVEPDVLMVNTTTPFPGTKLFEWAKANNLILTYDWDDYNMATPVMRLPDMDEKQIARMYRLMYKSFYLRPSFILKRLAKARSISDLRILSLGFKSLLSFLYNTSFKR